jgi:hypothetical protein
MSSPPIDLDEHVIFAWLGIPNNTASGLNPLVRALLGSGVTRWCDLLLLSAEHICTLTCTTPLNPFEDPAPLNMKNMTMVALALFHCAFRKIGRPVEPMSITSAQFNTFRVEECDLVTPLVHWKTPKPDASTIAAESSNRSNKPNAKDFTAFKDNAHCICAKEHFQTAWLCKILQDMMEQPVCKAIVIGHLRDKNAVKIWKRTYEAMGNFMTTQFTSQSISTHLTLMRPPANYWMERFSAVPLL